MSGLSQKPVSRRALRRAGIALTCALAASVAAACSSSSPGSPSAGSSASGSLASGSSASGSSASGSSASGGTGPTDPASITTPALRAQRAAAAMLKAFAPPPGARAVSRSPMPSSVLSRGPEAIGPLDNDVVTKTSWWLAPGDPQRLLAWAAARLPAQDQRFGSGTVGKGVWSDDFSLAAVAGLFDTRSLAVSVTSAGHGETAIRVDALVDWIPARPAGDTVPATARVATLTETADKFKVPGGRSVMVIHQATVTGPAKVAALARYLNGLPVNPPGGASSCATPTGGLTVTFRARAGGPVLAQAKAPIGGCDTLTYTMPGHPDIDLGGGPGGDNLLGELNQDTGQHWKIPQS